MFIIVSDVYLVVQPDNYSCKVNVFMYTESAHHGRSSIRLGLQQHAQEVVQADR